MTVAKTNKSRLCASSDGKRKVSRLKSMLPFVARFILAQGPAKMWAQIRAARGRPEQRSVIAKKGRSQEN